MTGQTDNPGVRFPPPLIYLGAVVVGWFLNRWWSLTVGSLPAVRIVAVALTLLWAGGTASSVGLFRKKHTSMIPIRPATSLVVTGPYRFTRNPMYVGLAVLTIAVSLFMNTWWPIILLVPVVLIVQQKVIVLEERYLRRRFGDEYEQYTRRVRRWL